MKTAVRNYKDAATAPFLQPSAPLEDSTQYRPVTNPFLFESGALGSYGKSKYQSNKHIQGTSHFVGFQYDPCQNLFSYEAGRNKDTIPTTIKRKVPPHLKVNKPIAMREYIHRPAGIMRGPHVMRKNMMNAIVKGLGRKKKKC